MEKCNHSLLEELEQEIDHSNRSQESSDMGSSKAAGGKGDWYLGTIVADMALQACST